MAQSSPTPRTDAAPPSSAPVTLPGDLPPGASRDPRRLAAGTAELLDLPGNPRPPGARSELVRARDGARLRCAMWPATLAQGDGTARGTVCLFHGRTEFIEKYYEVVAEFRARGFAVATLDWRGQGGSSRIIADGRLGHVVDFGHYGLDLDAFMRGVALPECPPPFYAVGHSMGAAILLASLGDRPPWFERLVALAPMVGLKRPPFAAQALARTLSILGFSRRVVPGWSPNPLPLRPFEGNPVTRDEARYERSALVARARPDLAVGGPTIGWVRAAFRLMRRLESPALARSWRTPTLILLAGEDPIVSNEAAEALAGRWRATRALRIEGALHELLGEREAVRQATWAAIDAFIPGTAG